ncbi:MAG: OmpA family protein [Caulobacteraceae bacterium]|nr:OmpA family protein [Caulobacteraceae bacterium]
MLRRRHRRRQCSSVPDVGIRCVLEWDRSNLNQAAIETIDAAVNRARQCNVSGTIVVGHTDTSGSPTYNQGLSERRASVVRDALVARGMAAGSIQTPSTRRRRSRPSDARRCA